MLSREQVEAFRADGVLPLGRVLTPEQVEESRKRLEDLIARDLLDKPGTEPGRYAFRRLNVSKVEPWFGTLARLDTVLDAAESVLGPDIQYFQDNIFYKPASVGASTPWHQDNIWWHADPPDMLTIWIALDDADAGNGAVEYVRGSNVAGLIDHTVPVNDPMGITYNVIDPARVGRDKLVSYVLKPGEAVMHHCLTIHGSPVNSSNRPRRGFTVHLMRAGLSSRDLEQFPMLRGRMPEAVPAA
ncbi:MAG: phytanoyl-CoA dioxygenase family protein [Planctomycetes bacterium]|nr:phytanoyl-CoA dioxygenase family protein [Planctomycetota bacterium]